MISNQLSPLWRIFSVALFVLQLSAVQILGDPSPNLPCLSMESYLPPAVRDTYDMSKHNGTWYEVSFRDLYPWGPLCDCQQSIKVGLAYIVAQNIVMFWFAATITKLFN